MHGGCGVTAESAMRLSQLLSVRTGGVGTATVSCSARGRAFTQPGQSISLYIIKVN